MKPCSKNRKRIAWLALDALEAREAAALRDHLAHCEGCRCYWEEMSQVTQGLAAAAPDSNLEASERFHHRVAEKLRAAESRSVLAQAAEWLRASLLTWRVALPAGAALVIAIFMLGSPRRPSAPPPAHPGSASNFGSDLAPTLANYQMVASQSVEEFSDLLTRQGNKRLPPAPIYTASGVTLAQVPF